MPSLSRKSKKEKSKKKKADPVEVSAPAIVDDEGEEQHGPNCLFVPEPDDLPLPPPVTEAPSLAEQLAFADGLMAPSLENLTVLPRLGGQEVDLLKGILHYYASSGIFIGSITNKLSFMKKEGGRLL